MLWLILYLIGAIVCTALIARALYVSEVEYSGSGSLMDRVNTIAMGIGLGLTLSTLWPAVAVFYAMYRLFGYHHAY